MSSTVVTSGETSRFIVLSAGDFLTVSSGGTVISATLESYSEAVVFSGGVVEGTTVDARATLIVLPGAQTAGIVVESGGAVLSSGVALLEDQALVSSAASFSGTTLEEPGDDLLVLPGGSVVSTLLDEFASLEIYAGGTADATVVSGGRSYVYSGGVASGTQLTYAIGPLNAILAGTQTVESGGVATASLVDGGGVEMVFGGLSEAATVSAGGTQTAALGGRTSLTTITSGGEELVSSGGTSLATRVGSGGLEEVETGGVATRTVVGSSGVQIVLQGATADISIVESGATLLVAPGAVVNDPVVMSGASVIDSGVADLDVTQIVLAQTSPLTGDSVALAETQFVLPGGVASRSIVSGREEVYSGGLTSGSVLASGSYFPSTLSSTYTSGGQEDVFAGGTSSATVISAGAVETVSSGGAADGSVVDPFVYVQQIGAVPAGVLRIEAGGSASATTVAGGEVFVSGVAVDTAVTSGDVSVAAGGKTIGTTVDQFALLSVGAGGSDSFAVLDGGVEDVTSGAVAVGTTIAAGGFEEVFSGGTASGAIVSGDGALLVLPGAVAVGTVLAGGDAIVSGVALLSGTVVVSSAAGMVSDSVVGEGETQYVLSGGAVLDAVVSGIEDVYAHGTTTGTTLSGFGTQDVFSGAVARVTVIVGGQQDVESGGTAVDTPVGRSGSIYVTPGGTAAGTVVASGGFADVSGLAAGGVISSGGQLDVMAGGQARKLGLDGKAFIFSGGQAEGFQVSAGGVLMVSSAGTARATAIGSGGTEIVSSGATAAGVTVSSGGELILLPGAVGRGITIESGGLALPPGVLVMSGSGVVSAVSGTLAGAIISPGESELVLSGGTAIASLLSGTSAERVSGIVYAGGVAGSLVVSEFAALTVDPGGTAGDTVVEGGNFNVTGTAVDTTVSSGGVVIVQAGGSLTGTTIERHGTAYVQGAVASDTVLAGGTNFIFSSGVTTATDVAGGGVEYVYSGGLTEAATVSSGGTVRVSSGGSAAATTLLSGGRQYVFSGGTATDVTVRGGGVQRLTASGEASGTFLMSGSTVDLAFLSFVPGGSAAVDSATDVLTVTEGGASYQQQLSGDYAGVGLQVTSDGSGGTLLTVQETACYCRGTRILTEHGEVAVEALRIGDRLMTLAGALRPIRWIGMRSYDVRFARRNRGVLPVLIRQGALGDGVPRRDLSVSPMHAMYLDGVLVPAFALVNGRSVVQPDMASRVDYFHVELDTHDVILAEGAASESFVDRGTRLMFQNALEFAALYPNGLADSWNYCAERVAEGAALEVVRRRIAARAGLAWCHAEDGAEAGRPEGCIDVANGVRVAGWACDPVRPHTRLEVEILVGGELVAVVTANAFRADLAAAGKGSGRCAFVHRFAAPLAADAEHVVVVRLAPAHELEARVPAARLTEPGPLEGCIDQCDGSTVEGWALDPAWPEQKVELEVLRDGVAIGRTLADRPRADLTAAGVGRCAFVFDLAAANVGGHEIAVRRAVDGRILGTMSADRLHG